MTGNSERHVTSARVLQSGNIPHKSKDTLSNDTSEVKTYLTFSMADMNRIHDDEEREGKATSVSSWSQDNDDGGEDGGNGFDDNTSQVGSDYSEFPANDMFALPHPLPMDRYLEEMKYNPSEMMLGPSTSSAMQFNYNFPTMADLQQPRPTDMPDPSLIAHLLSNREEVDAPEPANYNSNSHTSRNCIHPNMWYPNASIGSYRSYGSHPYARPLGPHYSHDHMMDMFQMSNSGREARNRAEKNRRDKLNGSIQDLSAMVPHVAESPRRVDKTAVLRFAAHGMRLNYVFGKSLNSRSVETTDALMKLLDSFFITVTCNGQIVLVSSSIEQQLGHVQTDLYGQNILHITHPEDHQMLKQKLIPADIDNLFDIQPEDENGEPRQRTQAEEDEIDRRLREDRRSFTIRLARAGPRSEATSYELIKIDGSFRRSDMAPRGLKTSTFPSTLQLMRRSRGREDILPMHTISGNDIVMIAVARIVRPPVCNNAIDVSRLEYKTRHLIDGRIIDCDQRISLVAGYMTDEVLNTSPFTFMHQDDVRWVIVALRQMYDCNSSFGESTYRLFTGNGKIIYLHTKGFLEIDKNTNQVHSFICVNTLLGEEEGKRRVQNMKNKFSVIVNKEITQSSEDVPASENPQQLERAVLCLIQNLHQSASDDDDYGASSPFSSRSQKNSSQHARTTPPYMSSGRSSKTPPLALVPPAEDSVKSSITKSVCVVKTTAGKFLRAQSTGPKDDVNMNDFDMLDGASKRIQPSLYNADHHKHANLGDRKTMPYYMSTGAMKRKRSLSASEKEDDDEYGVPMKRKDIENVLSSSLQQLDNRLNQQMNKAIELRDKGQLYDLPQTEEKIADIMNEHRIQREMYMDITTEFEDQRHFSSKSSSDNEHCLRAIGNQVERPTLSSLLPPSTKTVESETQSRTESDL